MGDAADVSVLSPKAGVIIGLRQINEVVVPALHRIDGEIRWQHRAEGSVHGLRPTNAFKGWASFLEPPHHRVSCISRCNIIVHAEFPIGREDGIITKGRRRAFDRLAKADELSLPFLFSSS
jgi:hypothetical protein